MRRSARTIRLEKESKAKIMGAAQALMDTLQSPLVMVCKDSHGQLRVWENSQPFNDAVAFRFEDD